METYHLLTIRITTSKKKRKKMKKMNPNGKAKTPFVTVLICNNVKAEAAKSGDFTVFKKWAKKGIRIEEEYCTSSSSKMQIHEDEDRIVKKLRNNMNWRVWNFNPSDRKLYIVRLNKSVWKMKKFRDSNNGNIDDFVDFLYIGETGVDGGPKERYKVHTRKVNGEMDENASDVVHNHSIELALDMMNEFRDKDYTRLEALKREKEVAEELKELGYATYYA